MTISRINSTPAKPGQVLYRVATPGRVYTYKKTYSKRIYQLGRRRFVIWHGMVSFVCNAYKGKLVVWSQVPMSYLGDILNGDKNFFEYCVEQGVA